MINSISKQNSLFESRVLVWYSDGAASAVAAKKAIEKYGDTHLVEVIKCDTYKNEHPDNRRFTIEIQDWLGQEIKVLSSEKYSDIYEVFAATKMLKKGRFAPCTAELKKKVRWQYQEPNDIHVFGYTIEEKDRLDGLMLENFDLTIDWILADENITKEDCFRTLQDAGIKLPMMYQLGYKNNNCIGCVKGKAGYWNKIRVDFPEVFDRMAREERERNFALCTLTVKGETKPVFLDELPPNAGNYKTDFEFDCGVLCQTS